MENILNQAAELGRLIRQTSIYGDFVKFSEELAADPDASKLLDEYATLSASLQERQEKGDIIAQFEFEQLKSLADMVTGNAVIMAYLTAREEYLKLLSNIQDKLGETA
ncbi:MAG: YlbF family regulator [Spirochaetes bacterium]|nr:YlbF family regulator [Spirochaetota bacterium]